MTVDPICSIEAKEIFADRGGVAIVVCVRTASGAEGIAASAPGACMGRYERAVPYDGGARLRGLGLLRACASLNETLAPALIGMDCREQNLCDQQIAEAFTCACGANAALALSQAIAKAGAASYKLPLYRHLSGERDIALPAPASVAIMGSTRYGDFSIAGGRPVYSFVSYKFDSFTDASYALWDVMAAFTKRMTKALGYKLEMDSENMVPIGRIEGDEIILELMAEVVETLGYSGRVGIHIDFGADWFFDGQYYTGPFDSQKRDRAAYMETLRHLCKAYPVVIAEDPLMADDFAGCAALRGHMCAAVTGNELLVSAPERIGRAIVDNACDAALIAPGHSMTLSMALQAARMAKAGGLSVMTRGWRGEYTDICDYALGLDSGVLLGCGVSFICNRMLEIESELGGNVRLKQDIPALLTARVAKQEGVCAF